MNDRKQTGRVSSLSPLQPEPEKEEEKKMNDPHYLMRLMFFIKLSKEKLLFSIVIENFLKL